MNNLMVAHLWAHEQEESASGSNFFFEGTSIYSYGHHFEVGRIVKNKQGKKVQDVGLFWLHSAKRMRKH